MAHPEAPPELIALADARAAARRGRDWVLADELKAQIEAAGWRVVDAASLYTLERAAAPDVLDSGIVRHGSSAAVPSRLDDVPVGTATVVLLATDWPDDLSRALRALVEHAPDGTQLVVVANAPSEAQAAGLETLDVLDPGAPGVVTEVVWTSTRLGHAAALNAGIRRAAAPVIIVMDTSLEPGGDIVGPLVGALEDESVGVAGAFGLVSDDLRRFTPPVDDAADVDVIEGYLLAFRRSDYLARGPLDEHFAFYRNLDVWWSLVLRDPWAADDDADDAAEGNAEDAAPELIDLATFVPPPARRAVRVNGLPLQRHEHRDWASLPDEDRDRRSKKNFYRVLKRFATRRDLLTGGGGSRTPPR